MTTTSDGSGRHSGLPERAERGTSRFAAYFGGFFLLLCELAIFAVPASMIGQLLGGRLRVGGSGETAVVVAMLVVFLVPAFATARIPALICWMLAGIGGSAADRRPGGPTVRAGQTGMSLYVDVITDFTVNWRLGRPAEVARNAKLPDGLSTFRPLRPYGRNLVLAVTLVLLIVSWTIREPVDVAPTPTPSRRPAELPGWLEPPVLAVVGCLLAAVVLAVWVRQWLRSPATPRSAASAPSVPSMGHRPNSLPSSSSTQWRSASRSGPGG